MFQQEGLQLVFWKERFDCRVYVIRLSLHLLNLQRCDLGGRWQVCSYWKTPAVFSLAEVLKTPRFEAPFYKMFISRPHPFREFLLYHPLAMLSLNWTKTSCTGQSYCWSVLRCQLQKMTHTPQELTLTSSNRQHWSLLEGRTWPDVEYVSLQPAMLDGKMSQSQSQKCCYREFSPRALELVCLPHLQEGRTPLENTWRHVAVGALGGIYRCTVAGGSS